MTINTLIAELRAGLGRNQNVWHLERDELHALLDHIESCGNELDALMAERAEFKRRAEAAEAELARLRKPVGEVKGVVRSLSLIACAPRCEHASECNCTVLDNAADLIQRLAGQVAEAQQDRCVPTCHEIADKAFAARDAAETRLREAVEVMREADDHLYEINMSNYDHDEVTRLNAGSVNASLALRAFLTTLEDHSNG